jgi:hypothetical protein
MMGGHRSGLFKGTIGSRITMSILRSSLGFEELPEHIINSKEERGVQSQDLRRRVLNNLAKDETTKKIINELYREGATVGRGGTADAIREELRNGVKAGRLNCKVNRTL